MKLSLPISNNCIVKLLHMYLQCTRKRNLLLFVHESSFPFMDDLNSNPKYYVSSDTDSRDSLLKYVLCLLRKHYKYNYELWFIIYNLTHLGLPRWASIPKTTYYYAYTHSQFQMIGNAWVDDCSDKNVALFMRSKFNFKQFNFQLIYGLNL